jgi:RNA polymerase sigma factor (TIGR02999 family)
MRVLLYNVFEMTADTSIGPLMAAAAGGDQAAAEALFAALYAELHRLAKRELYRSGSGLSLGVTTLLHEAYVNMSSREGQSFPDRARFMSYTARVMRGVIIDHVRNRRAQKRGGQFELTTLDTAVAPSTPDAAELTRLSDALDELAGIEPELAQVVDLKFFCGFSFVEIATMQDVSERTVQRNWEKARIFLHRSLSLPLDA